MVWSSSGKTWPKTSLIGAVGPGTTVLPIQTKTKFCVKANGKVNYTVSRLNQIICQKAGTTLIHLGSNPNQNHAMFLLLQENVKVQSTKITKTLVQAKLFLLPIQDTKKQISPKLKNRYRLNPPCFQTNRQASICCFYIIVDLWRQLSHVLSLSGLRARILVGLILESN